MRKPTTKDLAEFFRLALEAGLCRESEIENWADKMIVEADAPIPDWLLSLSTERETGKSELLKSVPGEADQIGAWALLLAKLGLAHSNRQLNTHQIVSLLFRWAVNSEIPKAYCKAAYNFGYQLDGVADGWYSEVQFLKDFENFFAPFRAFESSLPQPTQKALQ